MKNLPEKGRFFIVLTAMAALPPQKRVKMASLRFRCHSEEAHLGA